MNILLYVTAIILILASLNYAKMQGLQTTLGLKSSFMAYMAESQRTASEQAAEGWYKAIQVNTKNSSSTKRNPTNSATSRLGLYCLVNQQERERSPEKYAQTRELFKSLIAHLYKQEKFFLQMNEKNPRFLDALIDEIILAADSSDKQKIKRPEGLLNLVFSPTAEELHYTFYLMMQGKPALKSSEEEKLEDTSKEESHAHAGYVSLMDYISVRNQSKKVRVFLAPKDLLTAIFGDVEIASRVIELREELSRESKRKEGRSLEELTTQFKGAFEQAGHAQNYSDILDFSVTKTKPKKTPKP